MSWGGIDVRLVRAESAPGAVVDSVIEPEVRLPVLPSGDVLYLGRMTDAGATLLAYAELSGDSLLPLPSELDEPGFLDHFAEQRLPPGEEFVLFAEGARVGTFVAGDSTFADRSMCVVRPAVTGLVELVPNAGAGTTLLALPKERANAYPRGRAGSLESTYDQRVASLNLAGAVITQQGALWPPSLLESRRSLRVFDLAGSEAPTMATTFIHLDGLSTGPAPARSYSIFLLAQDAGSGYRSVYAGFRDYDQEGKGAPRYLTRLDWDGDGTEELFLEVFGSESSWVSVLDQRADGWRMLYEDPCPPVAG